MEVDIHDIAYKHFVHGNTRKTSFTKGVRYQLLWKCVIDGDMLIPSNKDSVKVVQFFYVMHAL